MKFAISKKTILLTVTLLHAFNEVNAFSLTGNFKTYPIIREYFNQSDLSKSLATSSKIQFNSELSNKIKFETSYELTATVEKPLLHFNNEQSYRLFDLDNYIHDELPSPDYKLTLAQNLNRLNINFTTDIGDLLVGRMPIAFGVAKSVSANDVLTPISMNSIDKEERIGVDAIVIKKPIGESVLLDVGFIGENSKSKSTGTFYLRPKFTLDKLDLTINLLKFKNKKLLGFELAHPIQDAGFWIDASFVDNDHSRYKDFSRLTTGVDYKFQSSLYLALEYHYNGSSLETTIPYPEDFITLRDYHYSILTASYELTPLLTTNLQSYFNPKDSSSFNTFKFDYNLTENSYLGIGSYLGLGNKTKSEFGRYGKIYFSSYRYYF